MATMISSRYDMAQLRLYWIVSAGSVFGYLSAFLLPVLVAPLINAFGFNDREIGVIFSLELSGIALAAIMIALRTHTLNFRTAGIAGASIACLGHLLSLLTDSVGVFGLARLVAGIGEGMVLATTFAVAARAAVPERAFAISQITVTVLAVSLLVAVPRFAVHWDHRAGIAGLLLAMLVFSPALLLLPKDGTDKSAENTQQKAPELPYKLVGGLILTAYVLMNIADIGIWAFSERTGALLEIPTQRIGELLAVSQLIGIGGSLAAAAIGTRFGSITPLSIVLVAIFFVVLGVGMPPNATVWTIAVSSLLFATLFLWPYLLGALAALDDRGAWTALGGSASAVGIAIAPLVAGYMAEEFSYREMTWLLCSMVIVALIVVHVAYRRQSAWRRLACIVSQQGMVTK